MLVELSSSEASLLILCLLELSDAHVPDWCIGQNVDRCELVEKLVAARMTGAEEAQTQECPPIAA